MTVASLPRTLPAPDELVGVVRRFGAFGPVYVVEALLGERDGEPWFEVLVPESGERAERSWAQILRDPDED